MRDYAYENHHPLMCLEKVDGESLIPSGRLWATNVTTTSYENDEKRWRDFNEANDCTGSLQNVSTMSPFH
jgi:hypothetical protein